MGTITNVYSLSHTQAHTLINKSIQKRRTRRREKRRKRRKKRQKKRKKRETYVPDKLSSICSVQESSNGMVPPKAEVYLGISINLI